MVDQLIDRPEPDQADGAPTPTRKPYHRPVLTRMGTLRDVTMASSNSGSNDGKPSKGTKRGGDFNSDDCGY